MHGLRGVKEAIISDNINHNITKILEDSIKKKTFDVPDYLYVTDLINPVNSYYSRKYKEIEIGNDIYLRMKLGEEYHFMARGWFEQMDGFSGYEIPVNGSHLNLNVVGRIDFMINNSVIEFKLKSRENIEIEDLYKDYLSDLEQLLFYSVLNKNYSDINYLVFYSSGNFYAYKIHIKNRDNIINEMVYRIDLIKRGLYNDDISNFPRCTYFTHGCPFQENNVCNCSKLKLKDDKWIINSINISEDGELENSLNNYSIENTRLDIRNIDLIYPRRYYHRIRNDREIQAENRLKSTFNYDKNNIKFFMMDAIETSALAISSQEYALKNSVNTLGLSGYEKYLIKNIYDETSIVPYILKINNSVYTSNIPDTYYSELAVICAKRNINSGLIIIVYPKLNNSVIVHEIIFNNEKLINLCLTKIEDIKSAVKNSYPYKLDMCPQFTINSCNIENCSCKMEIYKNLKNS
ncbi:hypothetical protein SE19_05375 [Acidiplasma aeolicum]|uniref:PD-(D/E)XK endonuclease-like domain-containing protein n=1 Tax=Acidiplasma aeolicum TaxID=507754 RepID=A0A0P9F485_9ARCH|nr:hypothetical protein [Acidiplasma aeolicum]KPV46472.1 hypothetical protein SE19_05375 [Acidiplasma aeolicum]